MKLAHTRIIAAAMLAAGLAFGGPAAAGPVVIDGTDANDHGFVNVSGNQNGWEYMQRVIENLAGQLNVSNPAGPKVITVLGINPVASQAFNALQSALGLSSVAGTWTFNYIDGAVNVATALAGLSTATTGILHIPTRGLSAGDMAGDELAAVNAAAAAIQTFVAAGGGLWAMGEEDGMGPTQEAFGWLSALIPGLVDVDVGGGGIGTNITLTPAGTAAFPGLSNADLAGADPWHNHFGGNLGTLSALGIAPDAQGVSRNVIIGGGTGTVIEPCGQPGQRPCPTPEPDSLPLVVLALGALALSVARRRRIQ